MDGGHFSGKCAGKPVDVSAFRRYADRHVLLYFAAPVGDGGAGIQKPEKEDACSAGVCGRNGGAGPVLVSFGDSL